ncbi:MAG: vanadium-dependent haloperoxidase [Candidatus Acidiferrum sp.]
MRISCHFGCLLLVAQAIHFVGVGRARDAAILWDNAALEGARDARLAAPIASRALAIVHTCMFDAWAAYDEKAIGTQLRGALRRPAAERTPASKERAISYAAYRALADLLPVDTESVYKPLMKQLGYDPNDNSNDIETPTGIGNVACAAVLEYRHHDKSNQLGDMAATPEDSGPSEAQSKQGGGLKAKATAPYSDWTGYVPVNSPGTVPARTSFAKPLNPEHWQPLTYLDGSGSVVLQGFVGAQWCYVRPFAMSKGDEFRSAMEPGPSRYGSPEYEQQAEGLIELSANLTDRQKMIAEYWSDSPGTAQPLGHWLEFAEFVSARDHHSLDDDVKMFFALSNAMMDAGIAAWDAKRAYDSSRPVTTIPLLFRGKKIRAWGGPGKGTIEMDGSEWIPYQAKTSPTPPYPDFVSAHSAYSAAAARILALWTGSDRFGDTVELAKGSSKIEPGLTPHETVLLKWTTFTEAADDAGISCRYGGINFRRSDLAGRALGRAVANRAWVKAQSLFDGTARPEL